MTSITVLMLGKQKYIMNNATPSPPNSAYEILGFNDIKFGVKEVRQLPMSDTYTTDWSVLSIQM